MTSKIVEGLKTENVSCNLCGNSEIFLLRNFQRSIRLSIYLMNDMKLVKQVLAKKPTEVD